MPSTIEGFCISIACPYPVDVSATFLACTSNLAAWAFSRMMRHQQGFSKHVSSHYSISKQELKHIPVTASALAPASGRVA